MSESPTFELVLYPDPVLRRTARPVEAFDEGLRRTVAAMVERMLERKGVGLAGPQVGLGRRILVLNPSGEPGQGLELINPTIVELSGPPVVFEEGCLSFPGIYAEIERPERCTIRACDASGKPIEETFGGFAGRILQHEHDHLEGVLLVDRMSPADKLRNKAALEELIQRYKASRPAPAKGRR